MVAAGLSTKHHLPVIEYDGPPPAADPPAKQPGVSGGAKPVPAPSAKPPSVSAKPAPAPAAQQPRAQGGAKPAPAPSAKQPGVSGGAKPAATPPAKQPGVSGGAKPAAASSTQQPAAPPPGLPPDYYWAWQYGGPAAQAWIEEKQRDASAQAQAQQSGSKTNGSDYIWAWQHGGPAAQAWIEEKQRDASAQAQAQQSGSKTNGSDYIWAWQHGGPAAQQWITNRQQTLKNNLPVPLDRPNIMSQPVYALGMIENELVDRFQQDQGDTYGCGSYAISMAFNILYEADTTGQDVMDAIQSIPYPQHLLYAFRQDGGATLPFQQANIVNDLGPVILGREEDLPHAEVREMSPEDLVRSLYDPNTVVLFTYNTDPGNIFSGHVVVLVAYDPDRGFGFLNSGADAPSPDAHHLTWKTLDEMEGYLSDPMTWLADFVVISRR